jgi:hypothetical protein
MHATMSVNITLRENFAYSESLTSVGPCTELPFIAGDGFNALTEVLSVSFPFSFLKRKNSRH